MLDIPGIQRFGIVGPHKCTAKTNNGSHAATSLEMGTANFGPAEQIASEDSNAVEWSAPMLNDNPRQEKDRGTRGGLGGVALGFADAFQDFFTLNAHFQFAEQGQNAAEVAEEVAGQGDAASAVSFDL